MSDTVPCTFTYSTHGVKLDVYAPPVTGSAPVIIFFHGGGMVSGSKRDLWFPDWLLGKTLPKGIAVISADYRLLHPSTPADIITDVHDLFAYIANPKSELAVFLAEKSLELDPGRIAVLGNSGGNYAARAAATIPTVLPHPVAWFSLFGMAGDFLLDHWVQPHAEEGRFGIMGHDVNKVSALLDHGEPMSHAPVYWSPDLGKSNDADGRLGLIVNFYLNGTILDYIVGVPGISAQIRKLPYEERLSAIPEDKRKYLLPATSATPPTVLVHGDFDRIVPYADAVKTVDDLKAQGIEVKCIAVAGADHGLLDPNLAKATRVAGWEEAVDSALAFIEAKLKGV